MAEIRRTTEAKALRPFIAGAAQGVNEETISVEINALLAALNNHKNSTDHDDRYYTEGEINTFLNAKADKSLTITAGAGLTGGGNLSQDRSFAVGAGSGIIVNIDNIAVDKTANFDWTGNHSFGQDIYTKAILPSLADVYDLGAYNKPWRKIWGSELSAVIFSEHEQALLGGWLTISKGEGKLLADLPATATQLDLGPGTYTEGDLLVIRGIASNGSPQVEYIRIGTLISGTTYNITRDEDGTGANDWPAGTVFGNWGQAGNGRLELNAQESPRFSVYSHGASLSAFNEQIRIGDLQGNWGYSNSVYGAAFGEYASGKPNLLIEPGVLRLRNYNQDVIRLTGASAYFENTIKLGTNGIIESGQTNLGQFNGIRWDAERLAGWQNGMKQWWGDWLTGKFYAGDGQIELGRNGITFLVNSVSYSAQSTLKWLTADDNNKLANFEVFGIIETMTCIRGIKLILNGVDTINCIDKTEGITIGIGNDTDSDIVCGLKINQQAINQKMHYIANNGHYFTGAITGTISNATNADKVDNYHASSLYRTDFPQIERLAATGQTGAVLSNASLASGYDTNFNVTNYSCPSGCRFVIVRVWIGTASGTTTWQGLVVSPGGTHDGDLDVVPNKLTVTNAVGLVRVSTSNTINVYAQAAFTGVNINILGYIR